MKYAVAIFLDQTWGYLCPDGSHTTIHKEAMLWDDKDQAEAACEAEGKYGIEVEEVPDVAEFQSREDTW
jgi:hypothetical protein